MSFQAILRPVRLAGRFVSAGPSSGWSRAVVVSRSESHDDGAPNLHQIVLVFGGTSCTHQSYAPFPVLQNASYRDLDCFFHLGDHVYQDGSSTLSQFRAQYKVN
jgi:phosphodiesterase/alkaline phosphatase D-like protein